MKRISYTFGILVGLIICTSCGSLKSSDCGLSKSLKIENIHDTKEAKIMLVDNTEYYRNQES
jgi:hypothetical protein